MMIFAFGREESKNPIFLFSNDLFLLISYY